jgi:multimeric flavodoxin WrbA
VNSNSLSEIFYCTIVGGELMETLYVVVPNKCISNELEKMVEHFILNFPFVEYVQSANEIHDMRNKKILFALEIGFTGFDLPMLNFFEELKNKDKNFFLGSIATLLIHSNSELGTKGSAQDIIFLANNLGCAFIGKPLVEATSSLKNFLTWQKVLQFSLEEVCSDLCSKLGERLLNYKALLQKRNNKITVLYSAPHKFSNTLELWHMISKHLKEFDIKEIQIDNGKVLDCKGCSYKLCLHYGKHNSCFYGGVMVDDVLPAIEESTSVIWLCPNYNDAIAANLTATINRLTVLYHKIKFYDKTMFGVVVSGNSGSDSVAKQLIGALNLNKGFMLPPYALITETANDPKAIFNIKNIEAKAENFAKSITRNLSM